MSTTKHCTDLDAARTACDVAGVRAALDAWFAAHGRAERVAKLSVRRVFYVPESECSVVYDAVLARGREVRPQVLMSRVCDAATGERFTAKAERKGRNGKFMVPSLGAPAYHLSDLGLVVWTFPNDPDLKTLAAHVQQPPHAVMAAATAQNGRMAPARATRTTVRYIPGKRCVFRYDAEAGDHGPQQLYAKVYEDAAAARDAHTLLQAAWRAAAADVAMLRVPEPLALDAEAWTTYQSTLPGTTMAGRAAAVTPGECAAIGRALAHLHLARLPASGVFRLADEHAKLVGRAPVVAASHPDFARRIDGVVRCLGARLSALSLLPLVPSHGTFKLAHLLHDGSRIGLVDFDSFVQADPLYDVANFTADLHYLEAAGTLVPGRAARLAAALHDAWCAQVPWGRRDAVLDWYVASLLVRKQTMKCVKHLHADATTKIGAVLDAAERRCRIEAP